LARVLSWLLFVLLMAVILPASLLIIVCLYAPFVALRAIYLMATGKVKPRFLQSAEERAHLDRPRETRQGPVPF
jgi:hypothetical protein